MPEMNKPEFVPLDYIAEAIEFEEYGITATTFNPEELDLIVNLECVRVDVCVPFRYWNKMVDFYLHTCTEEWWKDWKNDDPKDPFRFSMGPVVESYRKEEKIERHKLWSIEVYRSRTRCEDKDSSDLTLVEDSRIAIVCYSGCNIIIDRKPFDRIVKWYVSIYRA